MLHEGMGSEKSLSRSVITWLLADGWWALKTTGVGLVGCPDIVATKNGRFVAIELKSPTGKGRISPAQQRQLDKIAAAGSLAITATSLDEVKAALGTA